MKKPVFICMLFAVLITPVIAGDLPDTTINPTRKWAWAATAGWLNCRTVVTNGSVVSTNGLVIGENVCSGYMYSETAGWIHLGTGQPTNGLQYSNTSSNDYGVNHLGNGVLRGLAWSEGLGWVNFESNGNPHVDLETGILSGSAWTESADWVIFSNMSMYLVTDVMSAGIDTDSNSIPDFWEIEMAGSTSILGGSTNDYDGDGVSDYDEYVAYTDPTKRDSVFKVTDFILNGTNLSLSFPSDELRIYKVEFNDDLTNPSGWTNVVFVSASSGTNATTKTFDASSITQRFFRIKAMIPLSE